MPTRAIKPLSTLPESGMGHSSHPNAVTPVHMFDPSPLEELVSSDQRPASMVFAPRPKTTRTTFERMRRKLSLWGDQEARFETRVSRARFRLYWIIILMFYLLDGMFLVAVSVFYQWLLYSPVVIVHVEAILHLLPVRTLRKLWWMFALMAGFHLLTALQMIVYSIQSRELVFTSSGVSWKTSRSVLMSSILSNREATTIADKTTTLWRRVNSFQVKWINPFMTLNGKHFDTMFTVQEILQILSQTYQSYSLSTLVTTKWINQLAVALTFLNCVSSSVIRFLVPYDLPRQRFLCVLCDCVLGFIQAIVIPLIIFYPYYLAYDRDTQYFPDDLVYDDVWFIEAGRQLDQVLIVSYIDFFMTLSPHISFLWSLQGISRLLRTRSDTPLHSQPSKPTMFAVLTTVTSRRTPTQTSLPMATAVSPQRVVRSTMVPFGNHRKRLYSILCVLYGVLIVVIHFLAQKNSAIASVNCKSHLSPWLTKKYTCSIIYINCFRRGIRGDRKEMSSILQQFVPSAVSALVFSHCPALEIPPEFRGFDSLVGMDIYNGTLVNWGADASIDESAHPAFNYLSFEFLNLSGIPKGLLSGNLPESFTDFEVYSTNLTALPDDIGMLWPRMDYLFMEFCLLEKLPQTVQSMEIWFFSVAGNAIKYVDGSAFDNSTLNQLSFSNTPLERLPESLVNVDDLSRFSFEYTRVQSVPEWVIDWALKRLERSDFLEHSAFGTPFCDSASTPSSASTLDAVTSSSAAPSDATSELMNDRMKTYKRIACEKDLQTSKGFYPIDTMMAQRPL